MLNFVKRPFRALGRYVGWRLAHEYHDGKLFGQTIIRQAKDRMCHSMPAKFFASAVSATNVNGLRTKSQAQDQAHAHARARATNKSRIQKSKSLRQAQQDSANRAAQAENTRRQEAAEQKGRAYQQQVASRRTRRREDAHIETQRAAVRQAPEITLIVPEPRSASEYMEELRSSHPASNSTEECHQRTQNMLQSILGPERAKAGVGLPSGHSGISDDPVLVKYNQDQHVHQTLRIHDEYQAMQRQKWEEHQRKAAQQQAQRVQKIILFKHYWDMYEGQVKELVQLGPQLDAQIAQLLQAFDDGDLFALQTTAHVLSSSTLESITRAFDTMNKQIKLEEAGAQELRTTWPLANIERVLTTFHGANLASFDHQVQCMLGYMLQRLRAACAPIISAVPLINPLNDPEPQTFPTQPIPVSFKHYYATATVQPSQSAEHQQQPQKQEKQQPQTAPAPDDLSAGQNFSSFAALTASTKANSTAASNAPPSAKVQSVLTYINTHVLDFESNTANLVNNQCVSSLRRTENTTILKGLSDLAAGEKGLLSKLDAQMMKVAIELLISKIVNKTSKSERNKKATRELECLAHVVLKIWA